jgi:hypothetical protein
MQLPQFKGRRPVYFGDDVYLDASLKSVLCMGGLLIPVHHMHQGDTVINNPALFSSRNVRQFVSLLAREVEASQTDDAVRSRKVSGGR